MPVPAVVLVNNLKPSVCRAFILTLLKFRHTYYVVKYAVLRQRVAITHIAAATSHSIEPCMIRKDPLVLPGFLVGVGPAGHCKREQRTERALKCTSDCNCAWVTLRRTHIRTNKDPDQDKGSSSLAYTYQLRRKTWMLRTTCTTAKRRTQRYR